MDTSTPIGVIGAGLGGLAAAIKLKEAGYRNILLLEKGNKVGGTWAQNTYPGCSCDVPVALYQYSFAPAVHWTNTYPNSSELQAYCEQLVVQFGLSDMLQLNTETLSAVWDDTTKDWTLTTAAGAVHKVGAIVSALGQLNRPFYPDFKGRSDFAGPVMHSAAWDHSVDMAGKRVGVIGSAASAVQLIPEVAKVAAHLTVFQRTPNYVAPRGERDITPTELALMFTDPAAAMDLAQRNRDMIFDTADTFFWQAFSWTPEGRAAYGEIARKHLEAQVADPVLRAKLTPNYPVGAKRYLFTDAFYPAMCLPHVRLETGAIVSVDATGVNTADGTHHDLDILVYATGFETTGWHWSMDVQGPAGRLADQWADGPEAYLGITTKGFPNFFMLYGPHTNLGHNSITYMMERQIDYVLKALDGLAAQSASAMCVTAQAQQRFQDALQAKLAKTVWADDAATSWYKNDKGKITQNWGGNCREYAAATANVDWSDYAVS